MNTEKGKLLFYHCGKPVYEGSDLHKQLERIRVEFNGDVFAAAKHDAEEVKRLIEETFKK